MEAPLHNTEADAIRRMGEKRMIVGMIEDRERNLALLNEDYTQYTYPRKLKL